MRLDNKIKKNGGFSLLEMVLAIAIFSLASFSIAYLIIDATTATDANSKKIGTVLLAQEGIEAVRSIRDTEGFSELTVDSTQGVEFDEGAESWSLTVDPDVSDDDVYTRTVSIVDGVANTKEVTVSVTAESGARTITTTLVTQLTDWTEY